MNGRLQCVVEGEAANASAGGSGVNEVEVQQESKVNGVQERD